jgi:cell division septation protein DedD
MTDTVPGIPPPAAPPPEPLPPSAPPNLSVDLYKAVIGQKNQATYLRHFAQFDAEGKTGPTWHWAGFLSALNWMIFRSMWGAALLYAAFMLAAILGLFGIGKLAYDFSDTTAQMLFAGFVLLTSVLGGLYAHAAYYRFCKKKIVQTVGLSSSIQDARKRLRDEASTNRRLYGLMVLNAALIGLAAWGFSLIQHQGPAAQSTNTPREPATLPVVDSPAPAAAAVSAPVSPPEPASTAVPTQPAASEATPSPVTQATPLVEPPQPEEARGAEVRPAAKPASRPASSPAAAVPATASSPVDTHYFVQVGVFAVEDNALTLQEKLEAAGFRVHTLGMKTPKGVLIQVRVGPFGSKADAEASATRLQAMDLPTYIFKLKP